MIDPIKAEESKDRERRQKLLTVLYWSAQTAPNGHLSGPSIRHQVETILDPGLEFEDAEHLLRLLRGLAAMGLAKERPLGDLHSGERFGLRHVEFGITEAGIRQFLDYRAADPMIADGRVARG